MHGTVLTGGSEHPVTNCEALSDTSGELCWCWDHTAPALRRFALEAANKLIWRARANAVKSLGISTFQSTITDVSNFRDGMSYSKLMA